MKTLNRIECLQVTGGICPSYLISDEHVSMHEIISEPYSQSFINVNIMKGEISWKPEDDWKQNIKELSLIAVLLCTGLAFRYLLKMARF